MKSTARKIWSFEGEEGATGLYDNSRGTNPSREIIPVRDSNSVLLAWLINVEVKIRRTNKEDISVCIRGYTRYLE
jgi:hypothetical protein